MVRTSGAGPRRPCCALSRSASAGSRLHLRPVVAVRREQGPGLRPEHVAPATAIRPVRRYRRYLFSDSPTSRAADRPARLVERARLYLRTNGARGPPRHRPFSLASAGRVDPVAVHEIADCGVAGRPVPEVGRDGDAVAQAAVAQARTPFDTSFGSGRLN